MRVWVGELALVDLAVAVRVGTVKHEANRVRVRVKGEG